MLLALRPAAGTAALERLQQMHVHAVADHQPAGTHGPMERFVAGERQLRELENTLESSLVVNNPYVIDIAHLPPEFGEFGEKPEVIPIRIGTSLEDVVREVLIQTLKATKGNKRKAAQLLGINVRTIHRKIEEFGGDDFTS